MGFGAALRINGAGTTEAHPRPPPPQSVQYPGDALTRSVELLLSDVAGVQEGEAGGQENDGDPERYSLAVGSFLLGQLQVLP